MNLLSYKALVKLVKDGCIMNVLPEMINGTSIDVTLGRNILIEKSEFGGTTIDISKREPLQTIPYTMTDDHGYILEPGEFILAETQQYFNLPLYISAEYKLKSSMGRAALEHLNAGWCDPGWNGSVHTLELKNMSRYHNIRIKPGMPIGQMIFIKHEPVPVANSYSIRGRYNNDTTVKGMKP
jgi:dCTP deaminase